MEAAAGIPPPETLSQQATTSLDDSAAKSQPKTELLEEPLPKPEPSEESKTPSESSKMPQPKSEPLDEPQPQEGTIQTGTELANKPPDETKAEAEASAACPASAEKEESENGDEAAVKSQSSPAPKQAKEEAVDKSQPSPLESSKEGEREEEAAKAQPSGAPAETKTEASPSSETRKESPTPPTAQEAIEESLYQVKWIRNAGGTQIPLVTQNENGPCPLLAILNVLLLRGQMSLPPEAAVVTGGDLMARLGDAILRLAPPEAASALRQDYEANVSEAVGLLAQLATGIDVNVRFSGVREFEYTRECIVFDLLNIPLYHGWLVDAEAEATVAELLKGRSYNQVVEILVSGGESTEATILSSWLDSTRSQLTYPGLCGLHATLKDGELGVLFRNNHFATLLKHRDELFTLVTDAGFLQHREVVWETLSDVDGRNSHFVDAAFHSYAPPTPASGEASTPAKPPPPSQIDSDYQLALSLQAKESGEGSAISSPTATAAQEPPPQHPTQLPIAGVNAAAVDWAGAKHPAQSPLGPGTLLPDEMLAMELQRQEDQRAAAAQRRGSARAASAASSQRPSPKEEKCTLL